MKFMKVGSRPDTFYTTESVRSISSEVSSDLIIQIKETRYLLHKFPLLSKSLHLQRLCSDSIDSPNHQIVQLPDFPGGIESFELCAKFCYGITITISPYNFVSVRCAAEYLQMTEDAEKGNLIYKLEVFFNSCVLKGWKDSIVTLQTTKKELSIWSEDLSITTRCIEAIVSKVILYHRNDDVSCSGTESKRWWGEDLSEMRLDLYWRIMIAIKSCGKIQSNIVGDALKVYAYRWLTNIPKVRNDSDSDSGSDFDKESDITSKNHLVLETIVSLIPSEKGSVSCSFLFELLKASNILNVSSSLKMELAKRVRLQLEEATVNDLLIPSMTCCENDMIYEVDLVMNILEEFMLQQGQSTLTSPSRRFGLERSRSRSAENVDFELIEGRRSHSASHGLKLKVAKLVDKYLQEIAKDVNLPLSKFIDVAEIVPEFARHDHDDLYIAIDTYLKVHSELNKTERKRLCRILNCKKLSMESCMHATQNELLPLRLVVQVLFIEQARAASSGEKVTCMSSNVKALLEANGIDPSQLSSTTSIQHVDDNSSVSGFKSTKNSSLRMKLAEEELDVENDNDIASNGIGRSSRFKSLGSLPNKPKIMFSKFWATNRRRAEKN